MSLFIVDASAALAWILRSQSTARAAAFIEGRDATDVFVAPNIFDWEVCNVLLGLHRQGNLSDHALSEAIWTLEILRIESSAPLSGEAFVEVMALAKSVGLSLFDAAYLSLAAEGEGALVSRDARLLEVASARNLQGVDLR